MVRSVLQPVPSAKGPRALTLPPPYTTKERFGRLTCVACVDYNKNDSISSVKIRNKRVLENVNFRITQHFKICSFVGLYFKIKARETLY